MGLVLLPVLQMSNVYKEYKSVAEQQLEQLQQERDTYKEELQLTLTTGPNTDLKVGKHVRPAALLCSAQNVATCGMHDGLQLLRTLAAAASRVLLPAHQMHGMTAQHIARICLVTPYRCAAASRLNHLLFGFACVCLAVNPAVLPPALPGA
jgi:hypothetical protein